MKRERNLFLLGITMTISACGLFGFHRDQETPSASAYFRGTVSPALSQQVLEEKVREFFDWYTTRVDSLVDIQLVDNSGVEDTGRYAVNFDSTAAYLHILTNAGIFTRDYIEDKNAYFQLCAARIRQDSVRTATPYGLDADLILLSQEYEEDISNFSQASFANYSETENGASIDVTIVYTLRIDFVIQGDRLLIDKIDVVTPEGQEEGETH
ncbi:hypothetical protein L3C95_14040 [Chitinophaga filiformis]|uniref:hypothetical protein n=1 Tax=Chitinophaga filiformis TaxID=104663 RepID=UPI001F2BC793|nr:hypothetical protein [Chitinophaga filiformis]MCF6404010.1 hypothetical protein [Chitinophaga filiformis]